MTTLTARSVIGPDGTLSLEVPSGLPPGPVEVVIILQPTEVTTAHATPHTETDSEHRVTRSVRSGLFLNRGLVGVDVDAVTSEMDQAWKSKLPGTNT